MYTVKNISFHCIGSGRIPFISLRGNLSVIITLPLFLLLFGTKILNPFPHDKILDQTKLKAFADDKLNVTIMIVSGFNRVDNIVGKGEIACTSNFSFTHNVFKRLLSQTGQKVSLCENGLNQLLRFLCDR